MSKQAENPLKNYDDYMANAPFQTIKLLLPFLPMKNHETMVILFKFLELKYTMDYFKKGNRISFCETLPKDASPIEKLTAMMDFLPQKEQSSLEEMLNMLSVFEAVQSMGEGGLDETAGRPDDCFTETSAGYEADDCFAGNSPDVGADDCFTGTPVENCQDGGHVSVSSSSSVSESSLCGDASQTQSGTTTQPDNGEISASPGTPDITICSNIHF